MKPSDLQKLSKAYTQILKEDLGLGGGVGDFATTTVGVTTPDNSSRNYQSDASEMAETELKSAFESIQKIFNELTSSGEIEPWVASKITLATDYLNTVEKWISNNR